MAKPQEKIGSTAPRQIAPPPLSQHLRELASRPDAWGVLARNLIPVVGTYGFGWSAALAVFNYWFDGLTALAAIVAALIPRALRETQPKSVGATLMANLVRGVVTWIFLVGIVGLPYWIVLIRSTICCSVTSCAASSHILRHSGSLSARSRPAISGKRSSRDMTRCPTTS